MDNIEKDMQKQVLDLLTKEVQGTSEEKIDDENAIQVKQDADDKSGQGSASTTTVAEEKLALCPVCQTKADKTCGGCKSISYCSVEHQRLHWKTHQKCCSPFIIKETGTVGKGWIATRDLPAGTILLEELPVLCSPQWTQLGPCCVACGVGMIKTENKDRKCSTCSWPICSGECEKSAAHVENECVFFSTHKMTYPPSIEDLNGFQIMMIRVSNLKLRTKDAFDKLMKLQDFYTVPHNNEELQVDSKWFLAVCKDVLSHLENVTVEECKKLWRVFAVNSTCREKVENNEIRRFQLIYLQWSRMNHSCIPNCIYSTKNSEEFKMEVRTAVAVKKGESLTINYLPQMNLLQPTSVRRELLMKPLEFVCKCERCLDPTELGTFISGIKCQKCQRASKQTNKTEDENLGYFLPENPLDISLDPKSESFKSTPLFKCNGCGEKKLFSLLKSSLPSEIQRAFDIDANGIIENPEDFLAKYESGGNVLHKNHHLIRSVVEKNIPSAENEELELRAHRLEYLVKINDKLFPGLQEPKAQQHVVNLMLTVCILLSKSARQMSCGEIQKLIDTAQNCYKRGMEYCKHDNSVQGQEMQEKLQLGLEFLKKAEKS